MKKRIILTTLLLAALFALCMSAYAAEYDLWVGGVQLTSDNLVIDSEDNSAVTGTATYDPATGTLTLENFSYTGESSGIDVYADLTINLVGSSSLTVTNSGNDGISLYESSVVTFTGNGSLTINAEYGIYSYDDSNACEIINNASGTISILSENPISDSITVTGSGSFNINDSGFAEGVRVGGVKLDPGKYIDTDGNVSDTMPSGGYAYLSGDSSTLTLNNYSYTGPGFMFDEYSEDYAIIYAEHALTILVKGTNTLRSTVDTCIGGPAHFSIVGDGTLNLYSVYDAVNNDTNDDDYDIYDITITDCTLNIESGNEGIDADNDLHINGNAKVTVTAMVGDAVYAEDEMIIEDNAVVLVKYAEDDGLESEDDDTYIRGNARVTVEAAGDEGIEADEVLYIQDNAVVIIGASGDAGLLSEDDDVEISGKARVTVKIAGTYGIEADTNNNVKISDNAVVTIEYCGLDGLYSEDDHVEASATLTILHENYKDFVWDNEIPHLPTPSTPAAPSTPTITNPVPENATVSEDGTVTVPAEGGSVSYPATFGAGDTVTVTVTPDEHEKIASVVINGVEMGTSGVYVIENVTEALDIRVIFVKAQSFIDAVADQEPSEPEVPAYAGSALRFYDVMPHYSAYDAINFVADRGIMNGTGVGEFSPEAALTRSMMATILWRMEGEPTVWYGGQFDDVIAGQWYSTPIAWANAAGIVEGYGNGVFGLNDSLTHGQLCAMLYRWNTRSYGDIDTAWAWAQANGLYDDLAGVSADEAATRAGIAEVLMAFVTRVW